ncbi:hypothetical protein RJ639_047660 [Escallonia herrerae]|uniref:Trichome birefringence-like N-terminal domain-containing protein n=1 Tax=Escallonia herrerae TaxID=1293975 RepID=A0AA88UVW5_9ASTE|nr:hypothetical protein RJ639_025643 [Escallonia herrerae]KAK2999596.1 hypothetical protein RJ639_022833 [Escallonia herrerae]KAK3020712.1 hypothetical protein RJ639_047660 [Escallonia herrerae]
MTKPSSCLFLIFFVAISFNFFHCKSSEFNLEDLSWLGEMDAEVNMVQNRHALRRRCDFTSGEWVFDQSYPLYDSSCPYLTTAVTCKRNGRPDSDYEKWRWKPHGCSIPRFDALDFLGRMRRKRIMLVGDSIMRNQWESLVCLIHSVIPTARRIVTYNGPSMAFHALVTKLKIPTSRTRTSTLTVMPTPKMKCLLQDYEMSIEFSWAPLLVELKKGFGGKRILHLDLIEENAKYWRGVDVLVFDSAHWWTHSDKSSWDLTMEGNTVFRNSNPIVAYEKGLFTWAKWVDLNLDPRKTRVIFRSMSPRHNR